MRRLTWRLRHSFDLLVTDLAGCLQWFNPAMWLLRRELRAIHEYEADEAVLDSGVDARQYQLLLIRKAAGGRWYSVANSFNHSKLKNRITMMLRKRSSRWAGAKVLFLLPLTLPLWAFARTAYVFPDDKGKKENVSIRIEGANFLLQTEKSGKPLWSTARGGVDRYTVARPDRFGDGTGDAGRSPVRRERQERRSGRFDEGCRRRCAGLFGRRRGRLCQGRGAWFREDVGCQSDRQFYGARR